MRNTVSDKSGFALIITLWILAILVTAGMAFSRMARLEVRIARNNRDGLQARYLAKAGIVATVLELHKDADLPKELKRKFEEETEPETTEELFPELPPGEEEGAVTWEVKDNRIQITCEGERSRILLVLEDEESRIDLARVSEGDEIILEGLPGFDEDIVASILDWIDADDLIKLLGGAGAEDSFYRSLDPPYACKNAPLDVPEELLLVKGITPLIYWGEDANHNGVLDSNEDDGDANYPPDNADGVLDSGVQDCVTTFTGGKININTAGLRVWTALCEGDQQLAEEIISFREGKEGGEIAKSEIRSIMGETLYRRISGKLITSSSTFRIRSTGEVKKSKVKKTIEAVVKVTSGGRYPIRVFYWREY